MLLQERIQELGSGILKINNNIVELIGFMSEERLKDYHEKNINCFFSHGFYDLEELNFGYINDNALFIVYENNVEKFRYNFIVIKKDILKYKNTENKNLSKVYWIRKCSYCNQFNYRDMDESILFDSKDSLEEYFFNRFNQKLNLEI